MPVFQHVVYKITFPNGKIYVGMDIGNPGHSIRYFGTWDRDLVSRDFTREQLADFTLRKQILFESNDKAEIARMEGHFIRELRSNDPSIGYNQTHRDQPIPEPKDH